MRLAFAVLVLVACDPGEVTCFPAGVAGACGGYVAELCTQEQGGDWVGSFIVWTDTQGQADQIWECSDIGCTNIDPVRYTCTCLEYMGEPDTGFAMQYSGCK